MTETTPPIELIRAPLVAPEQSIPKGEFARLIGVSAGRVSQYIAARKITGEAIDGEGRGARIRPITAARQLKRPFDTLQRIANGLNTCLDLPSPSGGVGAQAAVSTVEYDTHDHLDRQIKIEKLEGLRRTNRRAAEVEASRAGTLVDVASVAAARTALVARFGAIFERSCTAFATALATRFGLAAMDVEAELRAQMPKVHAAAAAVARSATRNGGGDG